MKATPTALPEVLLLEPKVFGDARGFFLESWNARTFRELTGLDVDFVQDNHSRSARGVLRGLHYQLQQPQGKLVRVELSEDDHRQLWVPPGFAHGFLVLSESADFLYKTTDYYAPAHERCIAWNDPQIGIDWPLDGAPLLSAKDAQGVSLAEAQAYGD